MNHTPVLDTSFLIDLDRRIPSALALMDTLRESGQPLRVPAQAAIEYLTGLDASLPGLGKLTPSFDVVPVTDTHIVQASEAARRMRRAGMMAAWADIQVAALALLDDDVVVTADPKPFRRMGCKILEYREPDATA